LLSLQSWKPGIERCLDRERDRERGFGAVGERDLERDFEGLERDRARAFEGHFFAGFLERDLERDLKICSWLGIFFLL
jgi:hypothetical protein